MDSGCAAPEDAEEGDYQIERTLLPTEVIGIIDQLLCLEVRLTDSFALVVSPNESCRWHGTLATPFRKRF